ncbi:adaptor protein MecA [Desemzia sp. C1]|uniref:Adapter protein MecA n=1 Tax=Desemzia incerta TaxID=82801 RepID=A0A1I5VXW8_9LACT|nr:MULTISPECIES: adaptor protein MecA [Desemzia]MCI3029392.1 adaptor protein MecA [Desemzia sp. C1]SFQ12342.1 adapter protein MecA 1/2 [Desemzia incerta]
MEMERINEDTIRVEIDNSDLEERGIKFLDLLGNRKQIENFFYSILEEVDIDEQFHESDAITFQVLPKGNGLELFISKEGPSADHLDLSDAENFSKDEITQYIQDRITSDNQNLDTDMDEIDMYLGDPSNQTKELVVEFEDFEDLISLSKILYLNNAVSNVYYYNNRYYLEIVLFVDGAQIFNMERETALVLEFAKKTNVTSGILEEYGKSIIERSALETLRYFFK